MDFTLGKYDQLLRAALRLGLPIMTMAQYFQAGKPDSPRVILRHDVDRDADAALRLAQLEADLAVQATYYFRSVGRVFNTRVMQQIEAWGHEVGYHYETLAKAKGSLTGAWAIFEVELAVFRQVVSVHTVSMHGSPLSRWNNLDIWQDKELSDYRLVGEATLSVDYHKVYYFTDTGRTWGETGANRRDRAAQRIPLRPVVTTDDLTGFLAEADRPVLINAHPNRWTSGGAAWAWSAATDAAINLAKKAVWLLQAGMDGK
jgi:hypothetical protein